MAKKKPTKAELEALLKRFVALREQGQIQLKCDEARLFDDDLHRLFDVPVACNRVVLSVVLYDVKLPHGADPGNIDNYEVAVGVCDGTVDEVQIDDVADYDQDD